MNTLLDVAGTCEGSGKGRTPKGQGTVQACTLGIQLRTV